MIESLSGIFTAFGLSSSAGLNAYLPLLIVALTARFTNLINLQPPFDWLTNPWVIVLLAVLLLIEIFADKVPLVDHANDVIQTVVRPAAGAILFAANANVVTDVAGVGRWHPGSRRRPRRQGHHTAGGDRHHGRPGQPGGQHRGRYRRAGGQRTVDPAASADLHRPGRARGRDLAQMAALQGAAGGGDDSGHVSAE